MTATLSVWLGNMYGHAWGTEEPATRILKSLSADRWTYYLQEVLPRDRDILFKFQYRKPTERWADLVSTFDIKVDLTTDRHVARLIIGGQEKSVEKIQNAAQQLSSRMLRPVA
jgi:hypothetical protein